MGLAVELAMKVREISDEEFYDTMKAHKLWFETKGKEGKRADLRGVDLSDVATPNGLFLPYADLRCANLDNVVAPESDFRWADLRGACLFEANFKESDFRGANLSGCDSRDASFRLCDMRRATISFADMRGASVYGADLQYADLRRTCLRNVSWNGCRLGGADLSLTGHSALFTFRYSILLSPESATIIAARKPFSGSSEILYSEWSREAFPSNLRWFLPSIEVEKRKCIFSGWPVLASPTERFILSCEEDWRGRKKPEFDLT